VESFAAIHRALDRVRRRLVAQAGASAALYAVAVAALVAIATPLVGAAVAPHRAPSLGGVALGTGAVVALAALIRWRLRARHWRDPSALARFVGARAPEVSSDLLSSVQLEAASDPRSAVSRDLIDALARHTAARIAELDPAAVAPSRRLRPALAVAVGAGAIAMFAAAVAPDPLALGWRRVLGIAEGQLHGVRSSDVPIVGDVRIVLEFPAYASREPITLPSSSGDFRALPGTIAHVETTALERTAEARLVLRDGTELAMQVRGDRLSASFEVLEATESAALTLTITNKGKGPAQGLKVVIKDDNYDPEFTITDKQEIAFIQPGETEVVTVPLKAGFGVKTGKHKMKINITEHFGFDMDAAYLKLYTWEYKEPRLEFSGLDIFDSGKGTASINEDGRLQAGEQVKVKVFIQNTGQNVAKHTRYEVVSLDNNIYLKDGKGKLGDLKIGEVKAFFLSVTPNKRVTTKGDLPLYLTLAETIGKGNLKDFQLPIKLDQSPSKPVTLEVKADIDELAKKVQFEYASNKFTSNVDKIYNIENVAQAKTQRPNSVAVVIGVEKYTYLAEAPYAANDARIMKDYFEKRLGIEQVVIHTDEQVTGNTFENIFDPEVGELQKGVVEGVSDVFVFYSGHGIPSKDGKKVYLFPADGKIEKAASQGYDLNELYQNLDKLNAKSVTVFLDACFSGVSRQSEHIDVENLVAMKGVYIAPKLLQPWVDNPNYRVFASSAAGETSLGFDASKTGLFTYYLCAGLQERADKNKNGKITFGKLKDYVINNVTAVSKKIYGVQTPVFYGDENMILVEY